MVKARKGTGHLKGLWSNYSAIIAESKYPRSKGYKVVWTFVVVVMVLTVKILLMRTR